MFNIWIGSYIGDQICFIVALERTQMLVNSVEFFFKNNLNISQRYQLLVTWER